MNVDKYRHYSKFALFFAVFVTIFLYTWQASRLPTLGLDIWLNADGWRVVGVHADTTGGEIHPGDTITQIGSLHYADAGRKRGSAWLDGSPGTPIALIVQRPRGEYISVEWQLYPPQPRQITDAILVAACALAFVLAAALLPRGILAYRHTVIVLLLYALFVAWGGISYLQVWYSSPLAHAAAWLLAALVPHLYWRLQPLRPGRQDFGASTQSNAHGERALPPIAPVVYVVVGAMAVLEMGQLLPQSAFLLAVLAQIVIGVGLLIVQIALRNESTQRIILFGYAVSFFPGSIFVLASLFAISVGDITSILLSMVGLTLWPFFHVHAVDQARHPRVRKLLVLCAFAVIYLTFWSLAASLVQTRTGVWRTDLTMLAMTANALLLLVFVWAYGRFARAVDGLLDGRDLEQQVADLQATLEVKEREAVRIQTTVALHEKMAALGQVAAHLGHEVKNPLQILRTNLDMALEYPAEAKDALQTALGAVDLSITHKLGLLFNKIPSCS